MSINFRPFFDKSLSCDQNKDRFCVENFKIWLLYYFVKYLFAIGILPTPAIAASNPEYLKQWNITSLQVETSMEKTESQSSKHSC